ncbi:MAG: hypothetical protein ACYDH5_05200 [Acidimicrobiales bacterium]
MATGKAQGTSTGGEAERAATSVPAIGVGITRATRDMAFVAVGLGVMGLQQAQSRGTSLGAHLAGSQREVMNQVKETGAKVAGLARKVGEELKPLTGELGGRAAKAQEEVTKRAGKLVGEASGKASGLGEKASGMGEKLRRVVQGH